MAGIGVDCGTMNFVAARRVNGNIEYKRIRDAFIDLPAEHKRMLKISNTSFMELDGKLLVLGDEAMATANLFNREARRPLSGGLISSSEFDAQQVIALLLKQISGDPQVPNEKCAFSVPAAAIDVVGSDVTYHGLILSKIFKELGYSPDPVNEALAIIFAECASSNFSGLGISYGSGMTNVCLSYNAMSALEFSLGRGGDWIDRGAAKAIGTTSAKICSIKESGIDIMNPRNREEEAISLYVSTLIDYTIDSITRQFVKVKGELLVPKPIPIVVSGGTSLAGGFLKKFQERFEIHRATFPVQISEVRAASDPLQAVAAGLLIYSTMED